MCCGGFHGFNDGAAQTALPVIDDRELPWCHRPLRLIKANLGGAAWPQVQDGRLVRLPVTHPDCAAFG